MPINRDMSHTSFKTFTDHTINTLSNPKLSLMKEPFQLFNHLSTEVI
jgi:hypothetical protein